MSSPALSNLVNVRYYTPSDPYHYSVDNRPLTDLNTNLVMLAGLVDGISSGNNFYIEDSSSTSNVVACTTPLLPDSGPYDPGQLITLKVNNSNTGSVTLAVNSGQEYPIHGMNGNLQGGELVAGKHYLLSWENSDEVWEIVGSGKGNLQVAAAVHSAQAVNLGQLTDSSLDAAFNSLSLSGTLESNPATSGNEVVTYSQLTNGTFSPIFKASQRSSGEPTPNWLPNSSFLFEFAGWSNNGLNVGTDFGAAYAYYDGTEVSTQYTYSDNITQGWVQPEGQVNLSGWVFNEGSYSPASIQVNCYNSSDTLISSVASSSVPAGSGWTYLTNTGVFPSDTSYISVALGYSGLPTGGNVRFSELKLENNSFATPWSDEASSQLIQDGQLSPEFNNLTVSGTSSFNNYQERQNIVSTSSTAGWTETLDLNLGTIQVITLNSNGTINFTGVDTNGYACSVVLYLKQGPSGSSTVTWPTTTLWANGNSPTLSPSAGAIDVVTLTTLDGGTTWFGFPSGHNMSS